MNNKPVHPIFTLYPDTYALALAMNYNTDYVWQMRKGQTKPTARFRQFATAFLEKPDGSRYTESELFLEEI